jgi:hypothetical protein
MLNLIKKIFFNFGKNVTLLVLLKKRPIITWLFFFLIFRLVNTLMV